MSDERNRGGGQLGLGIAWLGLSLALLGGCPRTLTITQDPVINTAMDADKDKSIGTPLEVNIVFVYPKDLKDPANERLRPTSDIKADEWFAKRPRPNEAKGTPNRFQLPANQIYMFTTERDSEVYGTVIGGALRGANIDKDRANGAVVSPALKFEGGLHDGNSVIYVFPKFIDKEANVLPVKPVKFNPPGNYKESLAVHVGVSQGAARTPPTYGQYIQIGQ